MSIENWYLKNYYIGVLYLWNNYEKSPFPDFTSNFTYIK